MFYCYILRSEKTGRFYIGSAEDVAKRLLEHNSGRVTSTRGRGPWACVWKEGFPTRADAVKRERQIKSWKSAGAIRNLIGEV